MIRHSILGAPALAPLANKVTLTCLDIGARRGFTKDLLAIAPLVDAIGFEADEGECKRLNQQAPGQSGPWHSLRFLPVAVGPAVGAATLHLYRQRGCSSMLEADVELARVFSRADYYVLEDTVQVPVEPLDGVAVKHGFTDAAFMKIDVQGFELGVFRGARDLLAGPMTAVRSEISFAPMYKDQPLFGDIAGHLRPFGFMPMAFLELHSWRRTTRVKYPERSPGPYPYSQGQLIHGDVLFMKHPEAMSDGNERDLLSVVRAGLLALAYEHVDHAAALLGRARVKEYLRDIHGVAADDVVREASQQVGARLRGAAFMRLQHQARSALKGLFSR